MGGSAVGRVAELDGRRLVGVGVAGDWTAGDGSERIIAASGRYHRHGEGVKLGFFKNLSLTENLSLTRI